MSHTYCALPFQHLCIGPEGTARVCCVTEELVTEHGAPMSLNIHTMDEIWNSAYMRNVRRAMLEGKRVSACEVCYASEAATGDSYRTAVGLQPVDGEPAGAAEMGRYGVKTGFRVDRRPVFIKLEIGNLCNLKCRMCYGLASSQIERDPVHGNWNGGVDPLHAIWRGAVARIGPEPRIGVRTSGLYPHESVDEAVCRWTDGHAIFHVPLQPGTRIASLELSFHPSGTQGQPYQIVVNGRPAAKGILQSADAPVAIDMSGFGALAEMTVEILSSKIVYAAGELERGVPLSDLVLRREWTASNSSRPQLLSPTLAPQGPWYADDRKIFDDVFKSADILQRLYITGGEPLINERVFEVLDFLVKKDAAQHITLELSTNCTNVNADILERLRKFRKVELLLSLDAIGDAYEYIRYPARWAVVDANVRKLKNEGTLIAYVTPTVQVYNILHLVDLFRYCDSLGLQIGMLNLVRFPDRLAIGNLPPKARKFAAAKLFDYCKTDCLEGSKPSVLSLARHLESLETPANPDMIHQLMLFTNDLDLTRGQSFRATHPELVQLLAEDGFEWVDDTLLANADVKNSPARERVHAWL